MKRGRQWWQTLVGAAAVVTGGFLLVRPLTALLIGLPLGVALGAVSVAWRTHRAGRDAWAGAILAVGAVITGMVAWQISAVAAALPALMAAAGVGLAAWTLWRLRRPDGLGARLSRLGYALACLGIAALAWVWPDVATLTAAAGLSAAALVGGIVTIVRAWRRPRPQTTATVRQWPRRLRQWAAVPALLAVIGASAGSFTLLAPVPRAGDFYAWNDPVPATPGALLRVTSYDGPVPAGVEAMRILYATTYSDGSPALGSATVAIPTTPAPAGGRTVLSWQHGTTGVAQPCAPSLRPETLTEFAIPGLSRALERGWLIVAPDYPGQGTAGRYPYLIGEGEGRSSLDAIRAVHHLKGADASPHTMLWGHSQGGHATLWAGQLAPSYAPDLDIVNVAALSSATDPLTLAQGFLGTASGPVMDVITSYVVVPYADEYPDVTLDDLVHPTGQSLVRAFASRCASDTDMAVSVISALALRADDPLYRLDVNAGPAHDRLRENIASGLVDAPLFLGQGTDDEVVPITMQRTLAASLCRAGRTVVAHEYPGRTHMGVIAEGAPLIDDLFAWTDAVNAGQRPTTC